MAEAVSHGVWMYLVISAIVLVGVGGAIAAVTSPALNKKPVDRDGEHQAN